MIIVFAVTFLPLTTFWIVFMANMELDPAVEMCLITSIELMFFSSNIVNPVILFLKEDYREVFVRSLKGISISPRPAVTRGEKWSAVTNAKRTTYNNFGVM